MVGNKKKGIGGFQARVRGKSCIDREELGQRTLELYLMEEPVEGVVVLVNWESPRKTEIKEEGELQEWELEKDLNSSRRRKSTLNVFIHSTYSISTDFPIPSHITGAHKAGKKWGQEWDGRCLSSEAEEEQEGEVESDWRAKEE